MTVTFTDILESMIAVHDMNVDIEKIVLTEYSMNSFLSDDNLSRKTEKERDETIGNDWGYQVETGDGNYLLLEDGSTVEI